MLFICPKCKEKLNIEEGRAVCSNNHSYDRSRYGYYNLLLGQSGGTHGDNREMVEARRRFLARGFYSKLAERISELMLEYTPQGGLLLDAGCGEGYYTDILERALFLRDSDTQVYAFDISKDAVRAVLKKNPRITAAVAGSYHMPVSDGSVDTLINTFSPLAPEETLRVLRRGGVFIMAIPAEEHLFDLKAKIYDTPYKNTVADTALPGLDLVRDSSLSYVMQLSGDEISDLFQMTPYAYRTPKESRQRVYSLTSLECRADFRIFVYRKP